MIEFRNIDLKDKEWMNQKFKESDFRGCEYSFANLFMWRKTSGVQIADVDGLLCIASAGEEGQRVYHYPIGAGDAKKVLQRLMEDAASANIPFALRGLLEEMKESVEGFFPGYFEFTTNEGEWDYLYPVEKLTSLPGKKYHGKRNHIARFKDGDDWSYEAVTPDNLSECVKMNDKWCKEYGCEKSKGAEIEQCAVRQAFKYFSELGLEGGLLKKGGETVGFSIGEPLNSDTYVVHIEKAFPQIQGAYPMINQQFVIHNMQQYKYVNREEDMGEEGLRKAKMSYKPDPWLTKYFAKAKSL